MKILHSVRSLLKWKYLPARTWSSMGQGETTHTKCLGDYRNLSFYGNTDMPSISKPCHGFRKVLYTQRLWFKSDKKFSNCMCVVNRSIHIQHSVMMTETEKVYPGDGGKSTSENIKIMEKIESDVNAISKSVLEKMEETEKVGDDLRIILVACIRHLYSLRLSLVQIQHFLTENKDIYKHQHFISITTFLYKNGFNGRRVCKLVSKYPKVLDIPKDEVRAKIAHLRDLRFINTNILLIIEGLPEVLQIPTKTITKRISDLQHLFKSKDVLDLIGRSPPLLMEDLAVITAKFNYVFHVMGITQRQIMYSSLFKHSLNHIRQRHAFLVRSGFYKTRVKKGQLNPNPVLEDIVDMSTRVFLKKYGNMPMSDYIAFCELFERETRDADDEIDEYSDGEETHDEDSDDEETHKWKR
ncbi:transcription termination factor 4, mitochondrial-like [Mizuhopecten yessoensis]|uniref:mTERF domain-containing protein 2 n=1 Tax=Mizuhopecten yessoensis TaxID=6573 RepID=A0A210QLZ6_MIZYE|nr:transcription termination factor 4, mitochondrial-like [Mizuhopecten yessoensis]OWF49756.1 mTERF domain-containing protein 2 [Mizuhopecten yessoensis]